MDAGPSTRDRIELMSTLLLALAAVATAWCSYQATRWNGEQARAASRTNAIRIDASRADSRAQAEAQVDIATFIEWINARAAQNEELAGFYRLRFRAEFGPAFDAWLATDPFESTDAPPTPFAMPEYRVAARAEAGRLDAAAEVSSALVRRNIQRASNYVLGVVLFSVTLFFAGMSSRLRGLGARRTMFGASCVMFLGTLAWIATFPVSLAV